MDRLEIQGGVKLSGEVSISSAKNACLPIFIATLLNAGETKLLDLPDLRDMRTLKKLLERLGVKIEQDDHFWTFDASQIGEKVADYDLVKTMRASVLVLGPLLSRFGSAKVSLPGGCAIGTRPVDLHLEALKKMGAQIELIDGYIVATCDKLKGCEIFMNFPSVGATENIMMAAVYAEGETIIENAAKEPEIVDLANFLRKLGVSITGDGSSRVTIHGMSEEINVAVEHRCIPDRIEAMTYLVAALATESSIKINNIEPTHFRSVIDTLISMGAKFNVYENSIETLGQKIEKGFEIETAPYPGFPTDAQAQLMALGCIVDDISLVTESVFENRFMHVPELARMGAKIKINGKTATLKGGVKLKGARVMCTDLRASAALVIAALCADGVTVIDRIYHLDRGYADIENKLKKLGANVKRVTGD